MEKNSLLQMKELPEFSALMPDEIEVALTHLMKKCRETIENIVAEHQKTNDDGEVIEPTWDSIVSPIDEVMDRFSVAWGIVSHLNSVVSNDALREAHDAMLPAISDFYTYIGQHEGLYQLYKRLRNSDAFSLLSEAQQVAIKEDLISFELSGINLEGEQKALYAQLVAKKSELSSKFANNVLDATNAYFKHITDVALLDGLPQSALDLAKQEAKMRGLDGYVLTLKYPSYLPVLKYAKNRELRQEIHYAFSTRASEIGPNAGEFDNTDIIEEIRAIKEQIAKVTGFETAAERSLARKMAKNTKEVLDFLNDLVVRSKEQGKEEFQKLSDFSKSLGHDKLEPWDALYYSEKLPEARYSINDELIKPYFPLPKVLSGLFKLLNILYEIEIRPHLGVDTWHDDVRFYDVFNKNNEKIGSFYTDLYARDKKNGGAWMNTCFERRFRLDGSLQLPVAYVICNFTPPIGDKPSLLTHSDVETIFHEFGHAFHHLLTDVDVSSVSGINNVPWDAVELPSQFMENFTWQPEVLDFISAHVETKEPIPKDLVDKLIAAKNFNSALAMLRQLEFAIFDMRLYSEYESEKSAAELREEVLEQVSVTPNVEYSRFQNSFSHIFAGGYSAGYYSYKWAEVLSSDAFSRFEEEGVLNTKVGKDFLNCILKNGGSKDFMKMFIDFRGRKPTIDALLRHSGIKG
jgi:oligopeptidase A